MMLVLFYYDLYREKLDKCFYLVLLVGTEPL